MPGYGGKMEKYSPKPLDKVKTVEKRFVMPKVTLIQILLIAVIVAYAFKARKMNGAVVGGLALTVALLHMYDHMFLIKRGPEKSFLSSRSETYSPRGQRLRDSISRSVEKYSCQSCK
jgi:hypothetical protein|tara:strand:+ start:413 stop:763 length:351 start_codon:yes stop_codon:yes gene_type:complete